MKQKIFFVTGVLLALFISLPVAASSPVMNLSVESYVYNKSANGDFIATPAPLPYRWLRSVSATDMGVDALNHINEIRFHNGQFFITSGATVIVTDSNFRAVHQYTGVYVNDTFVAFQTLDGIFITADGEIYIAEPAGNRIWHLDSDFNFIRELGRPYGIPLSEALAFLPRKVAVDHHGRIYVISDNVFEGLVEINPDGTFNRYFGTIEISVTAVQLFWRSIQTAAQRARTDLWLPTTFTNIAVDRFGFVYATLTDVGRPPVMKLNARGTSILRTPDENFHPGSINFNTWGMGIPVGPSLLNFLYITDFGVFYVFDTNRNRVFAYDNDGHMLFAFGGTGQREGLTQNVTGMTVAGDLLVLADRGNQSLEIFELTSYGSFVISAARLQYAADWQGAASYWRRVIDYNPFFQYAYLGVGRYLYRHGYHEEAMWYFQRAQNEQYFSRAFQQARSDFIENNFTVIAIGGAALLVLLIIFLNIRRGRYLAREKTGLVSERGAYS